VDDLFATDQEECIDLPDADIRLFRSALPQQAADNCYSRIFDETDWQERDIFIWGKRRKQPRLIAWYGDKGASYAYSGNRFEPSPWTPLLKKLRQKVEALSQSSFNSVLLNLYRDSNDNMGWHSDNEAELGPKPTIASLSLGATREFQACEPPRYRDRKNSAHSRKPAGHVWNDTTVLATCNQARKKSCLAKNQSNF
jgi:alkylated DNA repair dioxygenase AlkB